MVMGHGFGATRDAGLLPFAERFAAAGADVLVFDYRGYGTSDGTPRQNVWHVRHREDYHAAIADARELDGVDPDRIVLWGSSWLAAVRGCPARKLVIKGRRSFTEIY